MRKKRDTERELRVLYEDDALVALDKPAGLLAVPIKHSSVESAFSILKDALKEQRQRTFVVHRIDRFSSGVLLFAKTPRDRDALVKQFLAHTPERQYLVAVRGQLKKPAGTLVHYFKRVGMHQQLRKPQDPKASKAELRYKVERELATASIVRVELVTGLQNQIRAQFSAIGHPVIGDRKYHPEETNERRIDRVALHAARLEFAHPRTGKKITVESKLPPDFERLVRALSSQKASG